MIDVELLLSNDCRQLLMSFRMIVVSSCQNDCCQLLSLRCQAMLRWERLLFLEDTVGCNIPGEVVRAVLS